MNKKNRRKIIRTGIQAAVLVLAGYLFFHAVVEVDRYAEPERSSWTNRDGFIALSYFGVDRTGSPKVMAKAQLDEHLNALHQLGFVTISQQDILNFYKAGAPLPEKALFLVFEDGRIDSSLYGQPLLEKYNFRATFSTYANKMGNSEHKFVQPKELKKMYKTGFWEMGTNGYRLTYINIFDADGRYLGVMDESDVSDKTNFKYYNHYLMDYIRDENMIPLETRDEMAERIAEDYRLMESVYTQTLGFVPPVYMIMHANALYNGMNERVAQVNDEQIKSLFHIHFNREGHAYNGSDADIYNLTRVQPKPYWSTNHLLMKIREDTGWDLPFTIGDERMAEQWTLLSGAAEFKEHAVIVTSPPGGEGLIYFSGTEGLNRWRLTGQLAGNVVGKQSIYIRYDRANDSFIRIMMENDRIHLDRKRPGGAVERVFSQKLSDIHWNGEEEVVDQASVYILSQDAAGRLDEDEIPIHIRRTRHLDVIVQDEQLRLIVDDEVLVDGWNMEGVSADGGTALAAEWSERNTKENIYDAVFQDVKLVNLQPAPEKGAVLFRSQRSRYAEWRQRLNDFWTKVTDWAIETF